MFVKNFYKFVQLGLAGTLSIVAVITSSFALAAPAKSVAINQVMKSIEDVFGTGVEGSLVPSNKTCELKNKNAATDIKITRGEGAFYSLTLSMGTWTVKYQVDM